jgi:hypothetical protein
VSVWTIAAQEGTGGERIAAELAHAADVPLLDRHALALIAQELDPGFPEVDELEQRLCGRFSTLALGLAINTGSAVAFEELELRHKLPALGRAILDRAAHSPCVICAPAAFAALLQHPTAVHARLWAPLEWRVSAYQRECLVDRHCAEEAIRRDDHRKHVWVKSLYHVDLDDARRFSLVLDASRFAPDRLVETLLVAGGARAAVAPT